MRSRTPRLVLPVCLIATLVAGCSDDHADSASPPTTQAPVVGVTGGGSALPGAGQTAEVDATDNVFNPQGVVTIKAGTTVTFANRGRNDHNVLPESGTDWGVQAPEFKAGATYTHEFDTPGTYLYYCSIHGVIKDGKGIGMVGTIEVTAS